MSLSSQFETNKEAETEGVRIGFAPNEDESVPTFIISRANRTNKKYTKALNKALKPYQQMIAADAMPEEMAQRLYMEVFIGNILLDWENIPLRDVTGNASDKGYADFNEENAKKLFKRLPDLYDELDSQSKKLSNFRNNEREAELKN